MKRTTSVLAVVAAVLAINGSLFAVAGVAHYWDFEDAVDGLADPKELVTVTPFADLPEIVIPEPEMSENALVWLGQYWSTLGMIGLALISLKLLRSMIKSAPISDAAPPPDAVTVKIGKGDATDTEEEIADRLGRFSGSGRSLRDEVSELVTEDPEAAANILKTWIGAAS